MRRRDFIALLGGAATWPLAARGQSSEPPCRIGVLMPLVESDAEGQERLAALRAGLNELHWIEGVNLRIEYRWSAGIDELQASAADLVGLKPNILVTSATTQAALLQRITTTIPIVTAQAIDPVGAGIALSLARPGGNITGFAQYESSIGVKWLELLKQIAPGISRVAAVYDPKNPTSADLLPVIATGAQTLGVRLTNAAVGTKEEIEPTIQGFASKADGGLIVLPGPLAAANRDVIIGLAAKHRLPAVYGVRHYAVSGGLVSYGTDNIDLWHRTAVYVDRICKGENPANLPIQLATKFDLVINLKTAKSLGLTIPQTLLATANEVIE